MLYYKTTCKSSKPDDKKFTKWNTKKIIGTDHNGLIPCYKVLNLGHIHWKWLDGTNASIYEEKPQWNQCGYFTDTCAWQCLLTSYWNASTNSWQQMRATGTGLRGKEWLISSDFSQTVSCGTSASFPWITGNSRLKMGVTKNFRNGQIL